MVALTELPVIDATTVLRTPEECFAGLDDFPYEPKYCVVGGLRVAYIDEGPRDASVVLLMHGEPTWSYLYRKMIPGLLQAGHRVVAPDLIGFGRSDKLTRAADYSYYHHVQWMVAWMESIDLRHVSLFCQDWGSLIGLRMLTHSPERFDRVCLANGGLPTGGHGPVPRAFKLWRAFARWSPWFPIGRIVSAGCAVTLTPKDRTAYDAPFPSKRYTLAARLFPGFVPTEPGDPERARNEAAWEILKTWRKPFLTLFSSRDPVTRGGDKIFLKLVPGTANQPHAVTRGAGHFLQEDKGAELAQTLNHWIAQS